MSEAPPPILGPPVVRVIHLSDFEAASGVFNNWRGRFEQISSGGFSGTLQIVRGRLVRIVGIEANQRVRLRGHDVGGLFSAFPVTPGNGGSSWQRRQFAPGHIIVDGSEAETDHYTAQRSDNRGISMLRQLC